MVPKFSTIEHLTIVKKALAYLEEITEESSPEYVKSVVNALENSFAPYNDVPMVERKWFDEFVVNSIREWKYSATPLAGIDLVSVVDKSMGFLYLLRDELVLKVDAQMKQARRLGFTGR